MSRKPLPEGKQVPKGDSLNSLITQLEDPRSLLSFLPEDTRKAFTEIPEDYLHQDENLLLDRFEAELNWKPSTLTEALRLNFWLEYDRVSMSNSENTMNMSNVYLGVCTRAGFYKIVHGQPHVLAFILSRPIGYDATFASLQELVNRKFHQILSLPIREGKKINIKLLELQMKTGAMVDLRNRGGYLQRSETKNLTMLKQQTEHTYTSIIQSKVSDKTAAQIEADVKEQLAKLEEEARTHLPPPEPRFVENEVVDAVYTDVTKRGD
jgi:hypothetical protein